MIQMSRRNYGGSFEGNKPEGYRKGLCVVRENFILAYKTLRRCLVGLPSIKIEVDLVKARQDG